MKKLISIILLTAIAFTTHHYFSKPKHSCEIVFEPYIPKKQASSVNDLAKLTIEEHIHLLIGSVNIDKAIQDFHLAKLYHQNEELLREEIATMLEVKKLARSPILSLSVANDSEDKAQQISYALFDSYHGTQHD